MIDPGPYRRSEELVVAAVVVVACVFCLGAVVVWAML